MTTQHVSTPNDLDSAPSHSPTTYEADMAALRKEIDSLRAQVAAQSETLHALMGAQLAAASAPIDRLTREVATSDYSSFNNDEAEGQPQRTPATTSRRALLKWGGLGAAAAITATGAAAITSQTAHAATGDNMVVGINNLADHETEIYITSTIPQIVGFVSDATNSPYGIGIWGVGGSVGTGVRGETPNLGDGVHGYSSNAGNGVYGESVSGVGIYAKSGSSIDIFAAGTGRILQRTQSTVGAPTSGLRHIGEQIRDALGDLYICIKDGAPGVWRKVAAGTPGVSGAINFLANPIRLLDTRSGVGASIGPWLSGSTHTLQVTGVAIGGVSVPSGAIGVVGNLTVVSPSAGGDLRVYPGPTVPNTSNINFSAGQTVANGVTAQLNGSGQFTIKADLPAGTHTHVLFDASGFIL